MSADTKDTKKEKSPIKPLGDRVVVRPLTDEEAGTVSASGIIIPDSAKKEKPEQGIVIAVGPGKWDEDGEKRIQMEVNEGDRVIFSKYGFDELKFKDKEYFIVSESSILGVINS
ncbi:co-chaperone GroES [Candidatus Kaiserbacteria bacterium]|nr:co-chaperone GroES [Candidatus Kaiserbacteria bacterium]